MVKKVMEIEEEIVEHQPISRADSSPTFTIFTATFNRAHTLPRLYQSLCSQTLKDFEWLVVDDGSTDNTASLLEAWQKSAPFPLRAFCQRHSGKHMAWNRGVRKARGELFLSVDSDDALVPHALERFAFHWQRIPPSKRKQLSGITALCQTKSGQIIGDSFPPSVFDSDFLAIKYHYRVHRDKTPLFRTSILRRFPFPKIEGSYVPESSVWHKIARSYKTRFVSEPLEIVLGDKIRLSHTKRRPSQHARVRAFGYRQTLNSELDYFRYHPGNFFHAAYQYARLSLLAGKSLIYLLQGVQNSFSRLLVLLVLPAAAPAAIWDRLKESFYDCKARMRAGTDHSAEAGE